MVAWLPRFATHRWTGCEDDGEYEGREFAIFWGRWTVSISFGRDNRRFD